VAGLYCNWSTAAVAFGTWLSGIRAVGERKQEPYELPRPTYGPNRRFVTPTAESARQPAWSESCTRGEKAQYRGPTGQSV
jgi:hypothetical protein